MSKQTEDTQPLSGPPEDSIPLVFARQGRVVDVDASAEEPMSLSADSNFFDQQPIQPERDLGFTQDASVSHAPEETPFESETLPESHMPSQSPPEGSQETDEVCVLLQEVKKEMHCPELLPFQDELVNNLSERIRSNVDAARQRYSTDGAGSSDSGVLFPLFMMDADRVQWLIKMYLRVRLKKLERFAQYYLDGRTWTEANGQDAFRKGGPEDLQDILHPAERTYAQRLLEKRLESFDGIQEDLPETIRESHYEDRTVDYNMLTKPNLDQHVIVKVVGDVSPIEQESSAGEQHAESWQPEVGHTYLCRYSQVRSHVLDGSMQVV